MNKLKELRKRSKITTRQLSKYVGIPNSVITYLENGRRTFRQTHIARLTSFFNVTSDYLLGISENGFIVYSENGNDTATITEKEYARLSNNIKEEIIWLHTRPSTITFNDEELFVPDYCVFRELKGSISDYDVKESLEEKIKLLLSKMTNKEIRKVIDFIENFILETK